MAGASKTLDPIEAAEADIAGSKDLIAAVIHDLGQHQRWLAHYHVAEKRHARRLMVHQLLFRLELGRRQLVRMLTRTALRSFRLARAILHFLADSAAACLTMLRRAASAAIAWLSPRVHALALVLWGWLVAFGTWAAAMCRAAVLSLRKWLAACSAWGLATSRVLARAAAEYASIASAWTLRNSAVAARACREGTHTGARWTAASSRRLAAWSWQSSVRTAKRTRAQVRVLIRASRNAQSLAVAWIAASSLALGVRLKRQLAWARLTTRILARASAAGASRGSAAIAAKSRALGASLQSASSAAATWTLATASTSARNSAAAALAAYAWGALNAKAMSRGAWRATPQAHNGHRSLVVRQCTALVRFEPRRAGLPAIRGTPAPFSSPAARASL